MLTAEIISVGTELLLGQIVDTHAPTMARLLAECGIGCQRRATIGDNFDRLVGAINESLSRSDVVITIGGLGPTVDDLTRDAIAKALGDELVHEPEVEARLREFFANRKIPMTQNNLRQSYRPASAQLIENPNGTAPGLLCQKNGKVIIAFPGPKGEFEPMARGPVQVFLSRLQGGRVIHSRVLRIIGMGESYVEDRLRDLMDGENPTVAPYAHTGEVHLRLTAVADSKEAAELVIDPMDQEIRSRLGRAVYGQDLTTLEQSVIEDLLSQGRTVATAESMTGGEVAARLTSIPGSSSAVKGGVVTYTAEAKRELLGVLPSLLGQDGPVSPSVAKAMALGVVAKLGTDYGVSVTGNAGPTSDVDGKPVGLVYVAVAGPNGVTVQEARYRGVREDIRRRASQLALQMLREALAE